MNGSVFFSTWPPLLAPNRATRRTETSSTRWIRYDGLTLKDHSVTDGSFRSGFGAVPVKSDTTSTLDKQTPV